MEKAVVKNSVSGTPKSVLSRSGHGTVPITPPLRLWRWRCGTKTGLVQAASGEAASAILWKLLVTKFCPKPAFFLFQIPRDPKDKTLPTKPFVITLRSPRRHPWKGKK